MTKIEELFLGFLRVPLCEAIARKTASFLLFTQITRERLRYVFFSPDKTTRTIFLTSDDVFSNPIRNAGFIQKSIYDRMQIILCSDKNESSDADSNKEY